MNNAKLLAIFLLVLTLSACGGGGAEVKATTTNTTMGQEFMDLNESYKQGIISEKEFENAKENIMDRYDN